MYRLKAAKNQESDIHMKLMLNYQQCPEWWYGVLFLVSLGLGLATCEGYPSQLPCKLTGSLLHPPLCLSLRLLNYMIIIGWAFFVSVLIGLIFVVCTHKLMYASENLLKANRSRPAC